MPTKPEDFKPFIPVVIGVIALVGLTQITGLFKDDSDDITPPPKDFDLPNAGSGIPQGWTPTAAARTLHSSMLGPGTDEVALFGVLQNATKDQLVAIYNEFTRLYWAQGFGDLFQWFNDDLSPEDLSRVLSFFNQTGL